VDDGQDADELAAAVAEVARERGLDLAVAESLTGGLLAAALARAEGASEWFRGGVVAYASEVKFDVLGVRPGPVVAEAAADQMVRGAARLLDADAGVAVTGVGGPDPQDGQPPGTVWIAVLADGQVRAQQHHFDGDPAEICDATSRAALAALLAALR
jgi:nicotinamide-nucleotide amidase